MDPLLSVEELAEIRSIGEAMMLTPIMVLRSRNVSIGSSGYDPQYAYGDDQSRYDYGDDAVLPIEGFAASPASEDIVAGADGNLKGWFVSSPQTVDEAQTGEIATINLTLVRLPVGTDIAPHDTLRVIATGTDWLVIDVTNEDTWPEWLKANVRRAE